MVAGKKAERYNLVACRKVATITYQAFREISQYIELNMTERQLAWRMRQLLYKYGSERQAFPVIVAFGEQAAEPHHKPTARKLKLGDIIKIDAGGIYHNMRGDVTRTYFFGEPDQKFRERYQAVYQAQLKAFKVYQAGKTGQEIDVVARNYLRSKALNTLFIHSLGHGVGRAIHQPPFLTPSKKGRRILQVGEVVTNEPGVYESGWGGIRIEDMIEITAAGPKWLGEAPKKLKEIILAR